MGLLIGTAFYAVELVKMPKPILAKSEMNIESELQKENNTHMEKVDEIILKGYRLFARDINNYKSDKKVIYGRENPMLYIKILPVEELNTEHVGMENRDNIGESDESMEKFMKEYNKIFRKIIDGSTVGYKKIGDTDRGELVDININNILNKINEGAVMPVEKELYRVSSGFGLRRDPFGEKMNEKFEVYPFHTGLDISEFGINNSSAYSMMSGIVKAIQISNEGYGNLVIVNHGDFDIYYAHLSQIKDGLKEGDIVDMGDIVGKIGSTGRSTGPHLHLEIIIDGVSVNPEIFIDLISRRGVL